MDVGSCMWVPDDAGISKMGRTRVVVRMFMWRKAEVVFALCAVLLM